jgi:hypothetical protein
MNRWIKAALTALALAATFAASAQTLTREAPRDVVPGRLTVTLPPEATLDGQPARLSPGVRIRDTRNMLVLSGSLAGKETPVVYRRDSVGLVHEVWLLTEAEYDKLGGNTQVTGDPVAVRQFQQAMALIFGTRR